MGLAKSRTWLGDFHFSLSCIGEGNGNLLQCSCLENPRDGGDWWAAVYGVTLSQTWLKWLSSSKCLLISWLQSPSAVISEPPKIKSAAVSTVFPSICHEVIRPDAMTLVFWMLSFYTHLFHFHQEALWFFFPFCHKGGVICISEVIDISPGNFDSSLCFIQPSISHDVLCI